MHACVIVCVCVFRLEAVQAVLRQLIKETIDL
jgi:hypothetical protein